MQTYRSIAQIFVPENFCGYSLHLLQNGTEYFKCLLTIETFLFLTVFPIIKFVWWLFIVNRFLFKARNHDEFLRPMKDYLPTRSTFIEKTITSIGSHFLVRPLQLEEISTPGDATFPQSTRLLTEQELEDAFATQLDNFSSQFLRSGFGMWAD